MRLSGLRSDSPLSTMGLRNGDEVSHVNGMSLASPESALEAYAAARTAPKLRVELVREQKPMALCVVVGPPLNR
jgi:S1-C subfamily serine protease